jgi:DNA-binding transcriptional ArsR family regulator
MKRIDRIIHEPVRLKVLTLLSGVKEAEFTFIGKVLSLTNGNLSVHVKKLEDAGYVSVYKEFSGRMPRTTFAITMAGIKALRNYWQTLDEIRKNTPKLGADV